MRSAKNFVKSLFTQNKKSLDYTAFSLHYLFFLLFRALCSQWVVVLYMPEYFLQHVGWWKYTLCYLQNTIENGFYRTRPHVVDLIWSILNKTRLHEFFYKQYCKSCVFFSNQIFFRSLRKFSIFPCQGREITRSYCA